MDLPFPENRFDAAVMALVIFYAPDPVKAVAEMARVVAPGGTVAAYIWDITNDGSPTGMIQIEMRAFGLTVPSPPSVDASRMEALQALWAGAGLNNIETRRFEVTRIFSDFEDYWATTLTMRNIGPPISTLSSADADSLKAAVRQRLPPDNAGRIACRAQANAISGRVPN